MQPASAPENLTLSENLPPPRKSRAMVFFAAVFVGSVRLLFGIDREIPQFFPDEFATIAMAKFLSGTGNWPMFDLFTWRPGLAVLLAPAFWFTDDPATVFRVALALNSVLAGVAVVLTVGLVERLTGLRRPSSIVVAVMVALSPMSVGASAAAWSEPLVAVVFLLTLRSILHFSDSEQLGTGLAVIGWASAGAVAHSRLLPLAPTIAFLVVARLMQRRRYGASAAAATVFVATYGLSLWFSRFVVDHVWGTPSDHHSVGAVLGRLANPFAVLESAVGQAWYQAAAFGGVMAVGGISLVSSAARDRPSNSTRQMDARLIIAILLPLLSLSALFMASRDRADQAIYGRYNDSVLWIVLAIGLATTWGAVRPAAAATVTVARNYLLTGLFTLGSGWYLHLRFGRRFADGPAVLDMVPGVLWLTSETGRINVLETTLLAVALTAAVALAVRYGGSMRSGVAFVTVCGLLLGVAAVRVHRTVGLTTNSFTSAAPVGQLADVTLQAGEQVGFRFVDQDTMVPMIDQQLSSQLYQWYLPDQRFVEDRGLDDDVGPHVFSTIDDPEQIEAGSELVWYDTSVLIALWKEPSP